MNYCLILGGTAGLGKEIHRQISSDMSCIIVGRRKAVSISEKDIFIQTDLENESSVRELIQKLEKITQISKIADFFWVSGILQRVSSAEITSEQILKMVDVNLRHPLLIARSGAIWPLIPAV